MTHHRSPAVKGPSVAHDSLLSPQRSKILQEQSVSKRVRWRQSGRERQVTLPLECLVRQTSEEPQRVIFALHGFGDNARNFSELTQEFSLRDTLWIVPNAPETLPFPGDGGQWYELFGNPHPQFKSSCEKVRNSLELVQKETGLDWSKFVLLGFSQGAFVSLYSALTCPHDLGGVVALSGYLAQAHRIQLPHAGRRNLPVFVAHGLSDQVVFPAQHFETLDILTQLGVNKVTSKTYKGVAHSLCAEELFDIRNFIEALP